MKNQGYKAGNFIGKNAGKLSLFFLTMATVWGFWSNHAQNTGGKKWADSSHASQCGGVGTIHSTRPMPDRARGSAEKRQQTCQGKKV